MLGFATIGNATFTLPDLEETLGRHFDQALTYMEKRYHDGAHYILHNVTAREAYNLIRAAAEGKRGDPPQYCDYVIPPNETHASTLRPLAEAAPR